MTDAKMIVNLCELEALSDEWDRLAVSVGLPQMAPALMLSWWRHLAPPMAEPRVIVVHDRGALAGIAPFFVERQGRWRRTDYRIPGITMMVGLSPLATPGREWEVAAATAQILSSASPPPDAVALEGAPLASHWPIALREGWPGRVRPILHQYHLHGCPTVTLHEDSFDAWFAGKSPNFRSQMRRLQRQFAAAGGTSRLSTSETLQSDIATFVHLHTSRWKGRGSSNLVEYGSRLVPMLEQAGRSLLEDARFRLRVLEIEGEAISAQIFLAAGESVLYLNGGWSERYAPLKPSMIGILQTIEAAFEHGDRCLDLGMGEQPYKLRFADGNDPVAWNLLLLPGRRMPLSVMRTAPMLTGHALRDAAKRYFP